MVPCNIVLIMHPSPLNFLHKEYSAASFPASCLPRQLHTSYCMHTHACIVPQANGPDNIIKMRTWGLRVLLCFVYVVGFLSHPTWENFDRMVGTSTHQLIVTRYWYKLRVQYRKISWRSGLEFWGLIVTVNYRAVVVYQGTYQPSCRSWSKS